MIHKGNFTVNPMFLCNVLKLLLNIDLNLAHISDTDSSKRQTVIGKTSLSVSYCQTPFTKYLVTKCNCKLLQQIGTVQSMIMKGNTCSPKINRVRLTHHEKIYQYLVV